MSLTGKKIKDSYKDLLIVDNNNAGVDGTMRTISDGEGTASALQVSEAGVQVNGDLNVTGNATGLTGTPDIAVRNITGVAATFTGVLTYEDVTNIDSVGIVTARTGIKVLAGGIDAVGVVTATSFVGSGASLTNLPASGDSNDITACLFI